MYICLPVAAPRFATNARAAANDARSAAAGTGVARSLARARIEESSRLRTTSSAPGPAENRGTARITATGVPPNVLWDIE